MATPYALHKEEGTSLMNGIPHLIKMGERAHGRGLAIFEADTTAGEEPPLHVHTTEDEVFYVVDGEVSFFCDGNQFDLVTGGMVFLPRGLPHTYRIPEGVRTRLLVMTFPAQENPEGWGGYVGDIESDGDFSRSTPPA